MKRIGIIVVAALAAVSVGFLTSCSKKNADGNAPRKIVAATGAGARPNTFVKDGVIVGYETDVLKEVFSRLPQYNLEIIKTEFASIFTGLDAGLYQVGYNQFEYNTTRGEKYIVSDVSGLIPRGIIMRADRNDIKGIFDLPHHKTISQPTNANTNLYKRWNAAHPDQEIILELVDDSLLGTYESRLIDGTIDFYYHFSSNLLANNEVSKVQGLKLIEVPTQDKLAFTGVPDGIFFLFPKGEEQLAADYNKAFEEAFADGSIHKIFLKYYETYFQDKLDTDYIEFIKDYIAKDVAKNSAK
ncbi:MAG: transporter substrate-binding domain-containing protein [Treponema sp.]|nr:transporter substrate-binding domain-containing protein [Treponema sp.]